MKNFITLILTLNIVFCCTAPCSAHSIDRKDLGISFTLSNDWINENDEFGISFYHNTTKQESIYIEAIDSDWAWSLELGDEAEIKKFCEDLYSDSELAQSLSTQNDAFVSVKADSAQSRYEYYNNTQYFRYEKAYTASAIGYYDAQFYETIFVTAKNGKLYLISYQRNSVSNHFDDVVNMLNSMSYSNGEIKIKINGERIYPDSAPMLIEGRTLVPIRAVAEKMGYSVAWDGENQLVVLTNSDGSSILHFEIGNDIALKNLSEKIKLDVPAIIVGGRTYLPLRAVAEAMEADVSWDGNERTVEITQ